MINALSRTFVALLTLGVVSGALADEPQQNATSSPPAPLAAEPAEVFFPEAYAEARNEMQVKLTNTSESAIEILNAKGSCGCTTTGLDKKALEPGESATMTVTFRGARAQAGQTIEKKVTVTVREPAGASLVIPVRAKVTAAILADPTYLRLDDVEKGTSVERTIHLRSTDGHPFAVQSVSTTGDVKSVTPTSSESAMEQAITVHVDVPAEPGAKTAGYGKVVVRTTHPRDKQIDLSVTWRLAEPVLLTPRYINLGNAPVGQPLTRSLVVQPRKRDKFENLTFSSDNALVTLDATPHPSREHTWDLVLTVAPELAGKPIHANVLIDTHVEPEGTIRVRVAGAALPKGQARAANPPAVDKKVDAATRVGPSIRSAVEKKADDDAPPAEKKPD